MISWQSDEDKAWAGAMEDVTTTARKISDYSHLQHDGAIPLHLASWLCFWLWSASASTGHSRHFKECQAISKIYVLVKKTSGVSLFYNQKKTHSTWSLRQMHTLCFIHNLPLPCLLLITQTGFFRMFIAHPPHQQILVGNPLSQALRSGLITWRCSGALQSAFRLGVPTRI